MTATTTAMGTSRTKRIDDMMLVVAAVAVQSVAAWFRDARQSAVLLWWRGSGARPCTWARVVVPMTLALLSLALNDDAPPPACIVVSAELPGATGLELVAGLRRRGG